MKCNWKGSWHLWHLQLKWLLVRQYLSLLCVEGYAWTVHKGTLSLCSSLCPIERGFTQWCQQYANWTMSGWANVMSWDLPCNQMCKDLENDTYNWPQNTTHFKVEESCCWQGSSTNLYIFRWGSEKNVQYWDEVLEPTVAVNPAFALMNDNEHSHRVIKS